MKFSDTNKIAETCHNSKESVFDTGKNKGIEYSINMESYDSMLLQNEADSAITKFEAEIAKSKEFLDARTALAELRKKHLG